MQGVPYAPKGEARKEKVVAQSVQVPSKEPADKTRQAKATASKTNRGSVERGDRLATERPDLAEKVRLGEVKPAEMGIDRNLAVLFRNRNRAI